MSETNLEQTIYSSIYAAFINAIRDNTSIDSTRLYTNVVIYTPFGVVHGRFKFSKKEDWSSPLLDKGVIELDNAEIEHLSNHMPTAQFNKFYVSVKDISGFSIDVMQ